MATTILPAVAAGLNDDEVGAAARARARQAAHPLAGAAHAHLHRPGRRRLPALGAHHHPRPARPHRREATDGRITRRDFVPSPLAHPHCYSICYLLTARRRRLRAVRAAHVARHAVRAARRLALHRAARAAGAGLPRPHRRALGRSGPHPGERTRCSRRSSGCCSEHVPADRPLVDPGAPEDRRARDEGDLHPLAHGRGELRRRAGDEVLRWACRRRTAATSRPARTTCSIANRTRASPIRKCCSAWPRGPASEQGIA